MEATGVQKGSADEAVRKPLTVRRSYPRVPDYSLNPFSIRPAFVNRAPSPTSTGTATPFPFALSRRNSSSPPRPVSLAVPRLSPPKPSTVTPPSFHPPVSPSTVSSVTRTTLRSASSPTPTNLSIRSAAPSRPSTVSVINRRSSPSPTAVSPPSSRGTVAPSTISGVTRTQAPSPTSTTSLRPRSIHVPSSASAVARSQPRSVSTVSVNRREVPRGPIERLSSTRREQAEVARASEPSQRGRVRLGDRVLPLPSLMKFRAASGISSVSPVPIQRNMTPPLTPPQVNNNWIAPPVIPDKPLRFSDL